MYHTTWQIIFLGLFFSMQLAGSVPLNYYLFRSSRNLVFYFYFLTNKIFIKKKDSKNSTSNITPMIMLA